MVFTLFIFLILQTNIIFGYQNKEEMIKAVMHQHGIGVKKSKNSQESDQIEKEVEKEGLGQLGDKIVKDAKDYLNGNFFIPKQVLHKFAALTDDENYGHDFNQDICGEAPEFGILKLKCNCDNGYIDNIPFAAFGVVYGDCPHYYYDTTCVKEVFDTVQQKYPCLGKNECEFQVNHIDFNNHMYTNPDPVSRQCEQYPQLYLKVVATCKCSKRKIQPTESMTKIIDFNDDKIGLDTQDNPNIPIQLSEMAKNKTRNEKIKKKDPNYVIDYNQKQEKKKKF